MTRFTSLRVVRLVQDGHCPNSSKKQGSRKVPHNQPLISIIIPVFNVEQYVESCIDSVLSQSYENIEIIIVDDGSTDSSGCICDKYATLDGRINVIHKANGGLSDARNTGIQLARGEFISFVDSDDFVSPTFIEALFVAAKKTGCQISAVPHGHGFRPGEIISLDESLAFLTQPNAIRILSSHEYQKQMLYQVFDTGAPWRLYRREILEKSQFPVGLYYEDLASIYKIIAKTKDIAVVANCNLYAYRFRPDSIIGQSYTPQKMTSSVSVSRQLYSDICAWYPDLKQAVASRCFSVNRMVYAQVPPERVSDKKIVWDELEKYRLVVLTDTQARKRERLAAAIATLGRVPFDVFCRTCTRMGLLR